MVPKRLLFPAQNHPNESTSMAITLDTALSRNGDILYTVVDADEAVMLNVTAGKYYALNAVAARIWELLEQPMTVGQLCAQICEEFEVDKQTCATAVLKFADDFLENGIVHASAS
jgi:hypothetical protein